MQVGSDSVLAGTFEAFFETKTAADVEGTMSYFSPDLASYIDATLGWDVLLEDMSLRTQLIGRIEATGYLGRILGDVPYGRSSELRHIVGGSRGGGFEWTAGPAADMLVGNTALELDADGLITRITSVYDSRQLDPDRKAALISASFPR